MLTHEKMVPQDDSVATPRIVEVIFCFRSWGVCFTYGAWFALEAFACMAYRYDYK